MSTREFDPRSLPVEVFAKAGGKLAGELGLDVLERLRDAHLEPNAGPASPRVRWTARGELRPVHAGPAEIWLHIVADVGLILPCQRCLEGVGIAVTASRSFMFVHGEAQAAALDEQTEDDVMPLTRSLDLIELVEDELLLALPLVPHHQPACAAPLVVPSDDTGGDAQVSPFAALAALQRSGGRLN